MLTFLPNLFSGIIITLTLMVMSVSIGFLLAIAMTAAHFSSHIWLRKIIAAIQFFIRGTPLLVQIFLIYYGLGQFEWFRHSFLWIFFKSPISCAVIALSLNTACYTSVLLMGAIHSVPKNEIDACKALGMSKWLALRRIILPRAIRIALPAYSNEVIIVLKCTSLASTITLLDVTGVIQQFISQTYNTVEWYLVAAGIYLVFNAIILYVFKRVQRELQLHTAAN